EKTLVKHGPYPSLEDFSTALAALPLSDADQRIVFKAIQDRMDELKKKATFTPQISMSEIRVIEPSFVAKVEEEAMKSAQQSSFDLFREANISWDQWMKHTMPYHGIRSNVKPGTAVAQPTVPTRVSSFLGPLPASPEGYRLLVLPHVDKM